MLLLGCHAQRKVPETAARPQPPALQLFEQAPSGLDSEPSFTDLSSLNQESAGSHGFVRAERGHFSDDRGTRLRFFGVNLTGVACLPERANASRLAKHLRKLGFNAVRLHAFDGPGALLTSDGQWSPEALARLDYFSAALKAEGIYFALSLHVAAPYVGLEGEALRRFPQGKLLDRFHEPFLQAQQDFARRLLGHENPHTGLAYAAEPALLYVQLSDEDTLLPSSAGDPDELPASFRTELTQSYATWLRERTAEGLRAPGPADQESSGGIPSFDAPAQAQGDIAEYLRGVELSHCRRLAEFVRGELGLRSMLVNSQANFGGLAGLLREAELSDFIDLHSLLGAQSGSQITREHGGELGVLASQRVFGKPFTVSEYGRAAGNEHQAESLPLLVGIAGLQDWDALFAYTYVDNRPSYEPRGVVGLYDIAGNSAKLAFVPMAAIAFRRGLVAPAAGASELLVPEQPRTLPFAENALPKLWQENGVSPALAAVHRLGITLRPGSGPPQATDALPLGATLGSDTSELLWQTDGPHARFSVDAPALKLVCGQILNSSIEFGDVSFTFAEFSGGFACTSLVSLDSQPVSQARRLLLTVLGRVQLGGPVSSAANPARAQLQYVPLTVRLPRGTWSVHALDAAGAVTRAVPVSNGVRSQFTTTFEGAALSYAITR